MTEAEKTKIREAIKNDVKLSKAYKDLLDAKRKGKLRKEINPDEIMITLVAKYGSNAAGLVDAALSRPAVVMDTCKQKYSAASGTLKYLTTGKATDKQIASLLGKTEAQVKKDKTVKGTSLPTPREAIRSAQKGSSFMQRWTATMTKLQQNQTEKQTTKSKKKSENQQVDGITGAAVRARSAQTRTEGTTPQTQKKVAKPTPVKPASTTKQSKPQTSGTQFSYGNNTPDYEGKFMKQYKEKQTAEKKEHELQQLYAACNPSIVGGPVDLKTLMEKGLVSQKDIQAYYNKHSKEFTAGMSAGKKGKDLAKSAYNHAKGNRCVGGCLGGVQYVNPDVPWSDDPAWNDVRRPGQEDNWGCDTYKILEKKGYTTIAIENHSYSRHSQEATRLRRTIASFPEGTTASFDNQIDYQIKDPQDYYGVIKAQTHPSKRCGHVATITEKGLCSDGFQPHTDGYDPTNYGRYVHLSLLDDTQISEDLAKQLIAEAYARREREAAAQTKQNAARGTSR